jgi:hypothetical protein
MVGKREDYSLIKFKSEFDFSLVFQGGKPSTQDVVMMLDDLLCRETRRAPGTMRIPNQDDVIAKAKSTAAGGINAILRLQARNDQFLYSPRLQFTVQVRFMKGIRSPLLDHHFPLNQCDRWMDLPS